MPWPDSTSAPAPQLAAAGYVALRNLQLVVARLRVAPQPEILAPRALFRLRRRRPFLQRRAALGQRPRSRRLRGHDLPGPIRRRATANRNPRTSHRGRIIPRPAPTRRHRSGGNRVQIRHAISARAWKNCAPRACSNGTPACCASLPAASRFPTKYLSIFWNK